MVLIGRLIEVISERETKKLGIVRNARIADVLVDNQHVLSQVKELLIILMHNENDTTLWKRGEDEYKEFSAYNIWDIIRTTHTRGPLV